MDIMKIKEIMIRKVISVASETYIGEVAEKMVKNRIHGVPVVENDKIVGIITESDFFTKNSNQIHLPSYIDFIKGLGFKGESDEQKEKLKALLKTKAKDIMTTNCVTISQEADVSEMIEIFRQTHFGLIPVVDDQGTMVGIVALADIINIVSHP